MDIEGSGLHRPGARLDKEGPGLPRPWARLYKGLFSPSQVMTVNTLMINM